MRASEFVSWRPKLFEVVLHTPIEAVLGPIINRAPSEPVKKWLATNFKNWLLKSPDNLYKLPYLPINANDKQKKAFEFNDLYDIRMTPATQTRVEHWMDFFDANPNLPRLERMSVQDVDNAATQWVERMNKAAMKQDDDPTQVKPVMEFPNGFRIVELTGKNALDKEGALMGHCVGSHCQYVTAGIRAIYSLRDPNNNPHATLEVENDGLRTTEIKGKQNVAPQRKYWPMLIDFIEKYNVVVDNDYRNIGRLQIYNDETGQTETMTQDQFKDMILDPGNVRGQAMLDKYASGDTGNLYRHGGYRRHGSDEQLGMFVALYGTERMTDGMVAQTFSQAADEAVQVVQHYGNRLSPQQQSLALQTLGGGVSGEFASKYKELLQAMRPGPEVVRDVLSKMPEDDGRGRNADRARAFGIALMQVMPELYGELVLTDPKMVEEQLASNDERAAGPFLVLLARGEQDKITLGMVELAFNHMTVDATKRAIRSEFQFTSERMEAALMGLATKYWDDTEGADHAALDKLVQYAPPDRAVLQSVFDRCLGSDMPKGSRYRGNRFAALLLGAVRRHDPQAVDQPVLEKALMAIDTDKLTAGYLKDEPAPTLEFQKFLFEKDLHNGHMLRLVQKIDPALYQMTVDLLRPKPVERMQDTHRSVKDKKNPGKYKQIKMRAEKKPEDIAKEYGTQRRTAIRHLTSFIDSMAREPHNVPTHEADEMPPLDPNSPKFKAAQQGFAALGKEALFNTAVRLVNTQTLMANIQGDSRTFGGRSANVPQFIASIPLLKDRDLAHVIDRVGYAKELMRELINTAPERVPGVMMAKGQWGDRYEDRIGKLDWKGLDKEKTFDALEAVWGSAKVPDGIKDNFTKLVFRRFKPSPAKLMDLLQNANNVDATRYVLRKTKKPSLDFLNFLFDKFPHFLTELKVPVPDSILDRAFAEKPKVAVYLMNHFLRGREETYSGDAFLNRIKRDDPEFARYAAAAQRVGQLDQFERYVRASELDDQKHEFTADKEKPFDVQRFVQHLNEFSDDTLLHIGQNDDSGRAVRVMFKKFPAKRLARLLRRGLLEEGATWSRTIRSKLVAKLDPAVLREAVMLALPNDTNNKVVKVAEAMIEAGMPFDDEFTLTVLRVKTGYGMDNVRNALIARTTSDVVKNYVADNLPYEMRLIKMPNEYVVKKVFDRYGGIKKTYQGNISVDSHFKDIVSGWFSEGSRYGEFKYRPNPVARKLLVDEARKRGGTAIIITRAVLRYIEEQRAEDERSKGTGFAGFDSDAFTRRLNATPKINMIPRGHRVGSTV